MADILELQSTDSSSNEALNLACSSSEFTADEPESESVFFSDVADHHPEAQPTEVEPYMFEPQANGSDTSSSEVEDDDEERLLNTEWCSCSNCTRMATTRESICCCEIDKMTEKMSALQPEVSCICEHPGFTSVCLDVWVLDTAYYQYRQQYKEKITDTNNRYRYTAYRQLARFVWGYLGKSIRVVLPSCAVNAIRKQFPSADDTYTGYLESEVQ